MRLIVLVASAHSTHGIVHLAGHYATESEHLVVEVLYSLEHGGSQQQRSQLQLVQGRWPMGVPPKSAERSRSVGSARRACAHLLLAPIGVVSW